MKRLNSLIASVLVVCSAAVAQKPARSAGITDTSGYKLAAVKVTGTSRYSDKEIIAACGLQIGQNAADGDFKEAVRRLGDSGLFGDVSYSYTASGNTVKLDLQLTDNGKAKLVPVHFENIVWFTDDALRIALQARVPLFKDLLPTSGNLADHVSEALQAMLTEKRLPGRVDYARESESDKTENSRSSDNASPNNGNNNSDKLVAGHQTFSDEPSLEGVTGIDFRVDEVSIRIRNLEFPGASPEQAALLATAARGVAGAEYSRTRLAATAKFDLLPVYLQRGYLNAKFEASGARVLPQPSSADADAQTSTDIEVDAILPVTPGNVYAVSGVDWKGASAISTKEVAALVNLPVGQPADAVRLAHDLELVTHLYRSRGFMLVHIRPDAQLDDEKNTVHYDLNVIEGDLYKMGELEITGLDTQARAKMVAAWTLREGQPYNADYPRQFIRDTDQLLPRGVQWGIEVHETPDPRDKTVDVEIHFKQR